MAFADVELFADFEEQHFCVLLAVLLAEVAVL